VAEHEAFLAENAPSIEAFRRTQSAAFGAEREAWAAAGEFDPRPDPPVVLPGSGGTPVVPDGGQLVQAPFLASVWRVDVRPGDRVSAGQPLLALEAMKLETVLRAPADGRVLDVLVAPGTQVTPGVPLVVLGPAGSAAPAGSVEGSAA